MAEDTGGDKSLPASAQKKQRAREEGNIPKSQDLNAAVALGFALLTMLILGPWMMQYILGMGAYYLANAHLLIPSKTPLWNVAVQSSAIIGLTVLPFAGVMLISGVAVNLAQVGFLFTGKPITPKFNRLNPITGFGRFFSLRSLMELAKSLAKLALVLGIVWLFIRGRVEEMAMLMFLSPWSLSPAVSWLVIGIWWRIVAAMVVVAIVDYAFQRWQHERDLRMTVQEARQEAKELEGDPQIKRRVRQLQRQLAAQRMMKEVPSADVIITNPTHYAIALRYDVSSMAAPVVVAKGMRLVAERIRQLAAEHRVPVVQRPELARTLYKHVDLGQAISQDLFRAVAEVLSFVYKIDQRAEKIRERQRFSVGQ